MVLHPLYRDPLGGGCLAGHLPQAVLPGQKGALALIALKSVDGGRLFWEEGMWCGVYCELASPSSQRGLTFGLHPRRFSHQLL